MNRRRFFTALAALPAFVVPGAGKVPRHRIFWATKTIVFRGDVPWRGMALVCGGR